MAEFRTLSETAGPSSVRSAAPLAEPREPPTAAALWPTFMRRTLAEEMLRGAPAAPPKPDRRPPKLHG